MGLGYLLKNIGKMLNGEGYLHDKDAEKQDVWINSLPTISPGDNNQNPIHKRINENGDTEYYRKSE